MNLLKFKKLKKISNKNPSQQPVVVLLIKIHQKHQHLQAKFKNNWIIKKTSQNN